MISHKFVETRIQQSRTFRRCVYRSLIIKPLAGTKAQSRILISLCRAIRTEAIATKHWTPGRRLERYRVSLATLIASDLKSLSLSCWSSRPTEVLASRISAGLATLWVSQVSFSIVLLFSFRELKRRVAFRTRDLQIWHGGFSKRAARGPLSLLRSAGVAFHSTRCVFQSALVIKHYAEKHNASRFV